jgi:orotidine-5'-phosphate decarboxylase
MNQLLVALDVDSAGEARRLADLLRGAVGGFKVGSRLFTSVGPTLVEELVSCGDRVFLDLKFHDIPSTVAGAVAAATRLGVWMMTVHAAGGSAMMRAARAAADEEAARLSRAAPLVVAVTVLTSMDQGTLAEVGVTSSLADQVGRLATLASAASLDGVVTSPQEIGIVRRRLGQAFAIVTPGVRGGGTSLVEKPPSGRDDQSRTLSAAEALTAGASYIVVGRPIIAAADPRAAADRLAEECRV